MKILIAGFICFLLSSSDFTSGQENIKSVGIREGFESEYYYAFTEATRYMIYQYYNQAVGLYKKCLEYNPGSAAIKYQLSRIYYRTGLIEESKKLGIEAWNSEKQNRWYLINLINIYQTTNRIDSAIVYTRELIALEPEKVENYVNLSVLYQVKGEYRKSLYLMREIEKNFGKSVQVLTLKYNVFVSMGNDREAINQLYSALEKDPENKSTIGMIAEFYRDASVQDSAAKYYDLLMKREGDDPLSVFSYLDYLLCFEKYNEAMKYFNTSMKKEIISKEQIIGYFVNKLELGEQIFACKSFYDSAIASFNSLNENDLRVSALYVDYNFKMKNFKAAADMLKKMIVKNELNYRIWEQLLFAENIMNQYDSIVLHGEEAIALFEDRPLTYLYTGIAYLQKKDYTSALKVLDRGLKYAEDKNILLQYFIFIADAYNGLMNRERAFEFYDKALYIDNKNDLVLNNYAYFLALEEKDLKKAEFMSKQTIKKDKFNAVYLDTYAWILYKMKENSKARHYIRKSMKHGGGSDKEINEHYNIIYRIKSEKD